MPISMVDSADVSNAVTGQRDVIVTWISDACDAAELEKAERLIRFVADSWLALGYGYKLQEMRARVVARAEELLKQEREYLAGCRRNCKTRNSTLANIDRLERLAAL